MKHDRDIISPPSYAEATGLPHPTPREIKHALKEEVLRYNEAAIRAGRKEIPADISTVINTAFKRANDEHHGRA